MVIDLATTNLLLGILAAVSILEALCLVCGAIAGYVAYRRVMHLVNDLEERRVAPVLARVNEILADVKDVTGRVTEEAERVDHAIRETMVRVDHTADRVRARVRKRASRFVGVLRGVRRAVEVFVNGDTGHRPPAEASGRL